MDKPQLRTGATYRITFPDGQPIEFKFIGHNNSNDSLLCEKKGGVTFFLETVEPFETITEIKSW